MVSAVAALALPALVFTACGTTVQVPVPVLEPGIAVLEINAPDFFDSRGTIRIKNTCDGLDISPAVAWSPPPPGTVTQVILLDDPDAPGGSFTHWLLYDLPADVTRVSEAAGPELGSFPEGTQPGLNNFGSPGYRGPCPPGGARHEYVLHVYGLDRQLGLEPRARRNEVLTAMEGHVIAHGTAIGTYLR